ncbi:MAG TPA: TIM barrel protein [Acidobacteriaceae bacterium]
MNRREFSQLIAGSFLGQALLRGQAQTIKPAVGPRFSVMLWTLEKQAPFERCLEIVAAAGYQGVELVGEFQKWSAIDTKNMMRKMRSLGLVFDSMSGVKAGFSVPAETDAFMAQLDEQIRWARVLECPQIILLSGKEVEGMTHEDQCKTSIENLKRASELADKNKIEIVIEPIDPLENPTIYLRTVTDGFEIVRSVNSKNLKVLYDFYHEQRSFGNLIEKLENNIDWVGLVHIADVPGRHEPGTGEIDYANIYRKLAELKYGGVIAMEYYPTGDAETSLKKQRLEAEEALRIARRA